jgi:hypothetical protein
MHKHAKHTWNARTHYHNKIDTFNNSNHCYGALILYDTFVYVCKPKEKQQHPTQPPKKPCPQTTTQPILPRLAPAARPHAPPPKNTGPDDNCQGTDDYPGAADYDTRFKIDWSKVKFNAKYEDCRAEMEPYLKCPLRATAGPAERAAQACADKQILDEAPEALEARLSTQFCEPGGKLVGRAFLDQMLATLDANRDGTVSCAEWGMAKRTSTLEDLGGAYHGPRSIAPPECPMTPQGTEALARYNAYLGELTSATMAAARAPADDEASREGVAAAAAAEGR